jgi:hypothetical protein
MSVDSFFFVRDEKLPTISQWQAALDGAGVGANQALQMALGIESQEQERKKRAAEKDAAITSRRCPKCGSPCPEYRKTCKACGFQIGRVV